MEAERGEVAQLARCARAVEAERGAEGLGRRGLWEAEERLGAVQDPAEESARVVGRGRGEGREAQLEQVDRKSVV